MKVDHWQEALRREFENAHGRKFRWGRHDCFQFTARCVIAVSGIDWRRLFPRYHTREGAEALLREHGGARGLLTKALGEPVPVPLAGVGDVVLVDMGRGDQPAVCMGLECFAPGMRNLQPRKTLTATAAWKI